ncbi:MAG: DUF1116 domain-containing protein [Candidatus Cloacimonetes bacterium]|nr:DUF1116 domain-containing protein [Candidatus Cloacimonadota bacterium]
MAFKNLKDSDIQVINIGLKSFAGTLRTMNTPVVDVDWQPPATADLKALAVLDHHQEKIDRANERVLEIIQNGKPLLIGLDIARNVIPGMHENMILHAGPPVTWDRMCGTMKGAVIGALLYEGKGRTKEEAESLAAGGAFEFVPCHEHDGVGPMAGIISPSMPVFILQNQTYGNYAFCTQNEGLGKVLRYGAFQPEVIAKLKWMEQVLYPCLDRAIRSLRGIDIGHLITQALQMGDEVHNRNRAGTSLLFRQLAPALIRTMQEAEDTAKVLEFINGNDHFLLNLSMPAAKAILDAAKGIEHSSIVLTMARNGTDFGIRLAGTGDDWFTGKAMIPDALYFPGYSKADANPDIGDSAITETAGWGGFAIAAAPAIVQFIGGKASDAMRYTLSMYEICAGESGRYQIPALDFRGTPLGIDVRKVIDNNLTPFIDTGVAHKDPGIGQIGAGVVQAPMEPFNLAMRGLADRLLLE